MTYLQAIISCHLLTTLVETAIVNVALNRQSWQSSTEHVFNASRANDGKRINIQDMFLNSCAHTNKSGYYTAWWQVDLGQNYNISHILLTTRNWEEGPQRIAGFSVFVSVTEKQTWQSQELCYRDSAPQSIAAYERRINCTNIIIGRYVVVYIERPVDNPLMGFQYSQTAVLELCEVDVPVEILNCGDSLCSSCNIGWYGHRCEISCENCGGEQGCNNESGVCLSQSCVTGFYGLYCSHSCSFNCSEDRSCDFSTGYCNHCPYGKYGQSCEFDCPVGCRTCENITLCYTCNEEFYGSICSKTCPGCGGNGSCSKSNGTCLSPSCRPRYYGNNSRCDQVCPSNCAGDKSCHYASGECVHGCTRGFYGQLCSKVCPENCGGDGSCNKLSGDCSNGCNPGWNGTGCDSKCGNGTFGLNCSQKCGRCKSNVCDNVYGTCHLGCESGWSNIRCNTETQEDTGKLHAAVIGGVLGALLFILLGIILIVAIFRWRQTRKKKGNMYMSQAGNTGYGSSGAVFIRWGREDCPTRSSTLLYTGSLGGNFWKNSGGGASYLCMHPKPQYTRKTIKGYHEKLYGGEYDIGGSTFGNSKLKNGDNIPCAVCQSTRGIQKLMIPGRATCVRGWARQYYGYLATEYGKGHVSSSEYICMDSRPTAADGGHRNDNGALPYPVQAACGALPCPKYRTGKTISCVVCTK